MNFVYVFSKEARDTLLSNGFIPVKFDEQNNIFAFHNKEVLNFAFNELTYLLTNTITF